MKKVFIVLSVLTFPFLNYSQEMEDNYFIALYTVGDLWDSNKSPGEQTYFKEHSAHLSKLRSDSIIVIGARYSETGMIILKSKNLAEAKNLLLEDIAVKNNLFRVEIHPFQPFYKGNLE